MKIPTKAAERNQKALATGFLWEEEPSCLDAAYERSAIEKGLVKEPVFKENQFSKCRKLTIYS